MKKELAFFAGSSFIFKIHAGGPEYQLNGAKV
jgi:hypothetical protein